MLRFASLVLLVAMPGCYRVHVGEAPDGVDGGIRRDAPGPTFDGDSRTDVPLRDGDLRRDAPGPDGIPTFDTGFDPCATVDCGPPPVDCVAAVCRDGVCFVELIPGFCGPDRTCDLMLGCVGGGPDAGRDAGFDAPFTRPDAPLTDAPLDAPRFDAPLDAPRFDAPPPDAPPPDAPFLRPDAPPGDAGVDAGPRTSNAFRCSPSTVITVNDRALLSSGPDVTLELWIRARAAGPISGKGERGGRRHMILELETTADGRTELVGGWTTATATALVRAPFGGFGRWTHVALVQRGGFAGVTVELWVDAMLVASQTFPDTSSEAFNDLPFLFCQLDADIDEVRYWGAALPGSVIATNRFMRVPTDSGGLVAYWPLEGMRQVQQDRTLLGNDAFLGITTVPETADPTSIADGAF